VFGLPALEGTQQIGVWISQLPKRRNKAFYRFDASYYSQSPTMVVLVEERGAIAPLLGEKPEYPGLFQGLKEAARLL
jgi:hypothetical protein